MLVLNVFGIAMILSAGSVVASQEGIGEFSYAIRQSIWFTLGLGALYCASKFDYRNLKLLARPLLYVTYFLMFLLYTPLGVQGGGATRWIAISGISFQPSEILKIATVIHRLFRIIKKTYETNALMLNHSLRYFLQS